MKVKSKQKYTAKDVNKESENNFMNKIMIWKAQYVL